MKGKKEPTSNRSGKRRDKGDGSLFWVESEKRWKMSFVLPDGRTKYLAGRVGGTKRAASDKLKKAMEDAKRGELVASSFETVGQYMDRWIEEEKLELKRNTYATWKKFIRLYINPGIGSRPLQKLQTWHIQALITEKWEEGELEAISIHRFYEVLRLALNKAVARHILGVSPCKNITLPRIEEAEMQVLDLVQARQLLTFLADNEHPHEALFVMAITTGMREGELRALRWSDIDWGKKSVRVQRTVIYICKEGYFENEPKTQGSKRTLLLTDQAIEVLRTHHTRQLRHVMKAKNWEDKNLVFPGRAGNYLSETGARTCLKRVLAAAGLPLIRFHDLRHTAATLLLRNKASLKSVQKILGHTQISTTMRYLHLLPEMEREDIANLNSSLSIPRNRA